MKYLVCYSYDGSKFYGSQRQKDKETVQGEIESVLSKVLNEKISIQTVSRTDRGVHAYESYATFETKQNVDICKLTHSVNSVNNKSIYVKSIIEVNEDFSIKNVKSKEYVYKINIGEYNPIEKDYCFQYNKKINIKLMRKALKKLKGTHDFRSFTSDSEKENYERTITNTYIAGYSDYVFIFFESQGFLRYMIRNIVGLLLDINEGKKTLDDIDKIFNSKDRSSIGKPAQPCGLYLNKVEFN